MHQPDYRDPVTGRFVLPWVRLHAAKDYLHMAEVLQRHPEVHVTVNFVPVLLEQLEAYASGTAEDDVMYLSRQKTWTREERLAILNIGFSIHHDNIIRRYPPYWELLQRRQQALENPDILDDQTYRDILAWFQLAWTDPTRLEPGGPLHDLVQKGRGYTVADLNRIIDTHLEMCAQVIPAYRELADRGQVELTTSPYSHPILPLLIDTDAAREATPGIAVPEPPFRAPEDARAQLRAAIKKHTEAFGRPPSGLWPSEGAVSQAAIEEIDAAGFRWLGTDEAILSRCLHRWFERDPQGAVTMPHALYQPYIVLVDNRPGPAIVFRDQQLSDRIGFTYQHIPGEQAAEDLMVRLQITQRRLADEQRAYLVSIILDGENCWEGYEHNGDVFLDSLYRRLAQSPDIQPVTVSEYLDAHRLRSMLARVATGSWINGDLTTWIGDPEHIRAWELLRDTRAFLVNYVESHPDAPREAVEAAWKGIYAAEGSDWFWWYSSRNTSDQDALFDRLFRSHLASVYRHLREPVPESLMRPISRHGQRLDRVEAQANYLTPELSANPDPTVEWADAICVQAVASSGTMQQAGQGIRAVRLAYDMEHLYLRVETFQPLALFRVEVQLSSNESTTHEVIWTPGELAAKLDGEPVRTSMGEHVLEMALPLARLGVVSGQTIDVQAMAIQGDRAVNRVPAHGAVQIALARLGEPDLASGG